MHDYNGMFFGGGYMWIFWIVLIVVVILVIRMAVGGDSGGGKDTRKDSPLEILEKRYARGEIDEEEYHRRRKELE